MLLVAYGLAWTDSQLMTSKYPEYSMLTTETITEVNQLDMKQLEKYKTGFRLVTGYNS